MLETQLNKDHKAAKERHTELRDAQQRLQDAAVSLVEKEYQLSESIAARQALEEVLNGRSYGDTEVNELRQALKVTTENNESMEIRISEAEAAREHMKVLESGARQELDAAREAVEQLKTETAEKESRAAGLLEGAQAASREAENAIQ